MACCGLLVASDPYLLCWYSEYRSPHLLSRDSYRQIQDVRARWGRFSSGLHASLAKLPPRMVRREVYRKKLPLRRRQSRDHLGRVDVILPASILGFEQELQIWRQVRDSARGVQNTLRPRPGDRPISPIDPDVLISVADRQVHEPNVGSSPCPNIVLVGPSIQWAPIPRPQCIFGGDAKDPAGEPGEKVF